MITPNNVTRLLDARGVKYAAYELPAENLGAIETAELLSVPADVVFKTIVVKRDKPKRPILALIPGTGTLDLKLLAAAIGEKKVYLPTEREAEGMTGTPSRGHFTARPAQQGFSDRTGCLCPGS